MADEDLTDLVEKGHSFVIGDKTTIVWQTRHVPSQEYVEEMVEDLSEQIPTAKHLVVPDLDDVYVVHDKEVEKEGGK